MQVFYDTSAVVPLLITEPNSQPAAAIWERLETGFAWRWLKVEVEAALSRRMGSPGAWENWSRIERALKWVTLPDSEFPSLCAFNRSLRLRSADAGHLYVMERCARVCSGLTLATFDDELHAAAKSLGLPSFSEN